VPDLKLSTGRIVTYSIVPRNPVPKRGAPAPLNIRYGPLEAGPPTKEEQLEAAQAINAALHPQENPDA